MDRFLIAPINSGLVTETKSWLQPNDAFKLLLNAYNFRGRVRKRFGSVLMGGTQLNSRLRIKVATVAGPGTASGTVPGAVFDIGQMFSINNNVYNVYQVGTPAAMLSTGGATTHTFNTSTGAYAFTGATPGAFVYWYPSMPVLGIFQYESGTLNNHPTFAFDAQFAYTFTPGTGWDRSGTYETTGSDADYVWASNWQDVTGLPILFTTNFNFTVGAGQPAANPTDNDDIWTWNGTTWNPIDGSSYPTGFFFLPIYGGPPAVPQAVGTGSYVQTARIIVPYKNRLILLNTVENDNSGNHAGVGVATQYKQRARYSFEGSPFARNAWYEPFTSDSSGGVVDLNNVAAGAGFEDASTEEEIISADFVKDRLIVYFERSTWELVYTGTDQRPFYWQKLNTELGSQSTFSTVPFDKEILTIGNTGAHACNGSNVYRIDDKIPDKVFEFAIGNNFPLRTCGIRDYITEMVYWTYRSDNASNFQNYPNKVLVYNYKLESWAENDDCITTFGYFEQDTSSTWADTGTTTWEQFNGTWNSNTLQANQRQILAGTTEGFIVRLDTDQDRNAPSMYITNIVINASGLATLTIVNHNLNPAPYQSSYDSDFILIENVVGDSTIATALNGKIFQVISAIDVDTITIDVSGIPLVSGTYTGGGTASRVSNIQITTKNFNPYVAKGNNVYIAKVDFAVERTGEWIDGVLIGGGAITVDYFTSTAPLGMIGQGYASGSIQGSSVLETSPYDPAIYPFEGYQDLLWHPLYFQSTGEFIKLVMYFSLPQMTNPVIALAPFELEAMCLYAEPCSRMQ